MNPLVYVIIPVYNAANYITNALNSILNQRYKNWCCVMINDFSSDNSYEVCSKLLKLDDRIGLINLNRNCGPAHVRNVGIDFAIRNSADYIAFLDSDDLLSEYYLERMVSIAEETNAGIVWSNIIEYNYEDQNHQRKVSHGLGKVIGVEPKRLLQCFFTETPGLGSMCNKLYSVNFINNNSLRLNEKRVRAEDWEFNLIAFQSNPKVVTIDDPLYYYIHYSSSVMSRYREQDYEMFWRSRALLCDLASKHQLDYDRELFDRDFFYSIAYHVHLMKNQKQIYVKDRILFIINDLRFKSFMNHNSVSLRKLPLRFIAYYILFKIKFEKLLVFLLR